MLTVVCIGAIVFAAWWFLFKSSSPSKDATDAVRLMQDDFMLRQEAMDAAGEMLRESVRQQHANHGEWEHPWYK